MQNEHLVNGIQQLFSEIGEAGCCALCLIDVAKDYLYDNNVQNNIDVFQSIYNAIQLKYIDFNSSDMNDENNMYVSQPELFLKMLTGKTWSIDKKGIAYVCTSKEYSYQCYKRIKDKKIITHFQRDNKFYPIIGSQTVKYGKLDSQRICKVVD